MSEKPETLSIKANRQEIADYINHAFEAGDMINICKAIGAATRLYDMSDIAKQAGIERSSLYRAFEGTKHPNFNTVLRVLAAMGFGLKVDVRHGGRAKLSRRRRPVSPAA